MLNASQYLPSEVLQFSNFPEVYEMLGKIEDYQKRLEPIMIAANAYNMGTTDGIYINIADVESLLALGYDITDVLGLAPNPCYDILMAIREGQEALHELLFSFRFERTPVVYDKQRTEMKRLNDVTNKSGEVI